MPSFILYLPGVLVLFSRRTCIQTKPVLGEVRCMCFQAWCVSGFVWFVVVFSPRSFELRLIIVCYFLSGFNFSSSKIVNTFAFPRQGMSYVD